MAKHADYWALVDHHDPMPPAYTIPPAYLLPLRHPHLSAPAPHCKLSDDHSAPPSIPVVDLAHYDGPTSSQLHSACAEWGVFQVVNHGVPASVLEEMRVQVDHFLALSVAERCPLPLTYSGEGYGTGFVRLETGITDWRDSLRVFTFPYARRDYSAWPRSPAFRKAIEDFGDATHTLLLSIVDLMSQNLGLSASRLQDLLGEMQQKVLMNHYPPCPQPNLAMGADDHTDVGALTCIWQQDDVPGLQVFHNGVWIPVFPLHGAIIILICDQIEIASNGRYKSCLHRVTLNAHKRRISLGSFYQLKPKQVVAPAKELIDDQHPSLYKATRFEDHEAAKRSK